MTAAMMGAYYGEQGFPKGWADKLQYKNLISSLSESFSRRSARATTTRWTTGKRIKVISVK